MNQKFISRYVLMITLSILAMTGCRKEVIKGTNGYDSIINTSEELSGSNCRAGGLKVEVGLDSNRNGTLDDSEIRKTSFICNNSPKTFSAKIDQGGVNAPVATIINNSLRLNITWSRVSQGRFRGVLDQNIDLSKAILLTNSMGVLCRFQSNNEIFLENACGVNAYCDGFANFNVEIKVY